MFRKKERTIANKDALTPLLNTEMTSVNTIHYPSNVSNDLYEEKKSSPSQTVTKETPSQLELILREEINKRHRAIEQILLNWMQIYLGDSKIGFDSLKKLAIEFRNQVPESLSSDFQNEIDEFITSPVTQASANKFLEAIQRNKSYLTHFKIGKACCYMVLCTTFGFLVGYSFSTPPVALGMFVGLGVGFGVGTVSGCGKSIIERYQSYKDLFYYTLLLQEFESNLKEALIPLNGSDVKCEGQISKVEQEIERIEALIAILKMANTIETEIQRNIDKAGDPAAPEQQVMEDEISMMRLGKRS